MADPSKTGGTWTQSSTDVNAPGSGVSALIAALNNTVNNPFAQPGPVPPPYRGNRGGRALGFY